MRPRVETRGNGTGLGKRTDEQRSFNEAACRDTRKWTPSNLLNTNHLWRRLRAPNKWDLSILVHVGEIRPLILAKSLIMSHIGVCEWFEEFWPHLASRIGC